MQSSGLSHRHDSMIGKLLVASTSVNDPVLGRSVSLVVHQDDENVFAVMLNRPMATPPGLLPLVSSEKAMEELATKKALRLTERNAKDATVGSKNELPKFHPGEGFPTHMPSKAELAKQAAKSAAHSLGTVHFGGPLSGPVVAVHDSSELAEAEAGRGIYVAAGREMLERLVREHQQTNAHGAESDGHRPGSFRLIVGHLGWSVDQLSRECDAGLWHVIEAVGDDIFVGDVDLWPSVIRRATTRSVARWLGIADVPFAAEVN